MGIKDRKKENYNRYMSKPGVREKRLEYYKQYYIDNIDKRKAYFKDHYEKKKAKGVSYESTDNL